MSSIFGNPATIDQFQIVTQSIRQSQDAVFAGIRSELGHPVPGNSEVHIDRHPVMSGSREFIQVAFPTIATALAGATFAIFSGAGLLAVMACYVCSGNLGLITTIYARNLF